MDFIELFQTTLIFFIILDALGNVPLFLTILKPFEGAHQRRIIFREMVIALVVMIFFLFFGKEFFQLLNIKQASLQIAGGIILFIIAIRMIFSSHSNEKTPKTTKEPLIVPLAVPAIAGPGILATISVYGGIEGNKLATLIAIFLAWGFSVPILLISSNLKKLLGTNGLIAIERLFGYLVALISAQTTLDGILASFKH